MTRSITLCVVLALTLTGCGIISRPVVATPPARCSAMLPQGWFAGVEAAPVPVTDGLSDFDQVKAWASAYVEMGGQLAKANGRTADTMTIIRNCEELVNGARADQ